MMTISTGIAAGMGKPKLTKYKLVRKLARVKCTDTQLLELDEPILINFGRVPNITDHNYIQDIQTGKGFIVHTDSLTEVIENNG